MGKPKIIFPYLLTRCVYQQDGDATISDFVEKIENKWRENKAKPYEPCGPVPGLRVPDRADERSRLEVLRI